MNEPVLIAGAGPVGLLLAGELALAGVPSVVLEQRDQPNERSLGMAINTTVIELLRERGLMAALAEEGFEFPQAHLAHIWLDPTRLPVRRPYTFAVPHSALERRLARWAQDLGVRIHRGTEVVGLAQDADGVSVTVRTAGAEQPIRGRWLVGCDGADSSVRRLAGIDFPGIDHPFYGLIGDVLIDEGDPLVDLLGVNQHDVGFFTIAPFGDDVVRVCTGEFGVRPADPAVPATLDELWERIERILDGPLKPPTGRVAWLSRWTVSTRQARRYRAGRVLLAGDAAHVHFPFGGQALSTGLEDAVNLGWKLAAEVLGRAPRGLLDTYHAERHPAGARACWTTQAQVALVQPGMGSLRDLLTELVRYDDVNAHLVALAGGVDIRYPLPGTDHALLGTRLPDVGLRTAGRDTTLYRLLSRGRGAYISFDGAVGAVPDGYRDRVDVVAATPAEVPEASTVDAALPGIAALLLRPDGRVAWIASAGQPVDVTGLTAALNTWFGEETTH